MLAAENGGLPGGKLGGMGDVLRDLPRALARHGHRVTVLTPAYGFLARLAGVEPLATLTVAFGGTTEVCRWLRAPGGADGVDFELLDHPRFAPGGSERIYHDDHGDGPFATDAAKFAFFCAAAAELVLGLDEPPDVVHLHDWHTGLYLLLRAAADRYRPLEKVRTVFSIHNLALQGVRPLSETDSCLTRWFPDLDAPAALVGDPRHPNCVNPMAIAIRLADAISTVSPTYAQEILLPPDPHSGRPGGEGLEALLAARHRAGSLTGILNGCDYPDAPAARPGFKRLVQELGDVLSDWIAAGSMLDAAAYVADKQIALLRTTRPDIVATSVGRATEQKLGLLTERIGTRTALERLLEAIGSGLLVMLGSGDPELEQYLQRAMSRHSNMLFLKGYSDRLADVLYRAGDVFLMPSVFEPCGISQMLAMRAGQPCVAHAVGGLRDTVTAATGFPFDGETRQAQSAAMVRTLAAAVELRSKEPAKWLAIRRAAKRARFTWDASAERYLHDVYGFDETART